MRRQLANAVRREFDACLRRKLQQFYPVMPKVIAAPWGGTTREVPPGYRMYVWKAAPQLLFFLVLEISRRFDQFTMECAWTRNGRYPSFARSMFPRGVPRSDIPAAEAINGDMRFRLGELFPDPHDHWWWVAPRASFEEFNKWLLEGDFEGEKLFGPPEMPIEQAMKNVRSCVEDAVQQIVDYAIPYFEEVIVDYSSEKSNQGLT